MHQRLRNDRLMNSHFQNALTFLRERRYQLAIEELDKVLKVNPEHLWAKNYRELCEENLRWEERKNRFNWS